jgi:hypothetical protein
MITLHWPEATLQLTGWLDQPQLTKTVEYEHTVDSLGLARRAVVPGSLCVEQWLAGELSDVQAANLR